MGHMQCVKNTLNILVRRRKAQRNLGDLDVYADVAVIHPTDDMLHGLNCEDGNQTSRSTNDEKFLDQPRAY